MRERFVKRTISFDIILQQADGLAASPNMRQKDAPRSLMGIAWMRGTTSFLWKLGAMRFCGPGIRQQCKELKGTS